jgi:hypothetical protein
METGGRDRQSLLLVRFKLYRTPVGVISGLTLFRLVAFWGRSAMGWSVPFSLGEFLIEGPLLRISKWKRFTVYGWEFAVPLILGIAAL